jgi:1,4-dihydroxy-2-naphthoyl-CoA hydrolase
MYTLDSIHSLISPYFPGLMAIQFTELKNDRVVATLQVRKDLCTPGDILHGGATMVWQTSITNEAGKLCALVTQTQLVLEVAV